MTQEKDVHAHELLQVLTGNNFVTRLAFCLVDGCHHSFMLESPQRQRRKKEK
jgi:hypothetical protein